MRYVTETMTRAIVSTRLLGIGEAEGSSGLVGGGIVERAMTVPAVFHCIGRELDNKLVVRFETKDPFCGQLYTKIRTEGINRHLNKKQYKEILNTIYHQYCKMSKRRELMANIKAVKKKGYSDSKRQHGILNLARKVVARREIIRMLTSGRPSIPELLGILWRNMIKKNKIPNLLTTPSLRVGKPADFDKPASNDEAIVAIDANDRNLAEPSNVQMHYLSGVTKKARKIWTGDDTRQLFTLRKNGHSWDYIARKLVNRTKGECRQKVCNLVKAEQKMKQTSTNAKTRLVYAELDSLTGSSTELGTDTEPGVNDPANAIPNKDTFPSRTSTEPAAEIRNELKQDNSTDPGALTEGDSVARTEFEPGAIPGAIPVSGIATGSNLASQAKSAPLAGTTDDNTNYIEY